MSLIGVKMAKKVVLYGTSTCTWCARTRKFFKEHKIKYKEIDVGGDAKAAQEMIEKSGQIGVPVIDIGGKIVVGFDEDKLRELLKIR